MNNRFKFRAWDKELKKMRTMDEDADYDEPGYNEYWFATWMMFSEALSSILLESDRFILMQSTGLLDKHRKEIFEGDVVKWVETGDVRYHGEGEVRWNTKSADYEIMNGEDFERAFGVQGDEYEVVGNIYESPELI